MAHTRFKFIVSRLVEEVDDDDCITGVLTAAEQAEVQAEDGSDGDGGDGAGFGSPKRIRGRPTGAKGKDRGSPKSPRGGSPTSTKKKTKEEQKRQRDTDRKQAQREKHGKDNFRRCHNMFALSLYKHHSLF